jgi:hypothetical protein
LSAEHGVEIEVASEAPEFAQKVLALMDPERASRMGNLARVRVLSECAWPASYALLDELLERDCARPRSAVRAPATDNRPTLTVS